MDVSQAIVARRAYRSLDTGEVDERLIADLAEHAGLAASCFNHQPWRFVFVHEPAQLAALHTALASSNQWARRASLIVAVCSQRDLDCLIKGREYYLFDTGMATAHLILRATELGWVAHPIAGYNERRTKEILAIPEEMTVITLLIIGRHAKILHDDLTEKQKAIEQTRPARIPLNEFAFANRFGTSLDEEQQ